MRKLIFSIALACLALSCQKPYVTTLDLAVDYYQDKGIIIPAPDAGACNIHITSNGEWSSFLESGCDWAHLENMSGSGCGYVRFVYKENTTLTDRTVRFTVTGQGKEISFPITQSKAKE